SAVVDNPATDPRFAGSASALSACDGRHLLAVPVRHGQEVVAVIELADRYDGAPFSEADRAALERAAASLGATIEPERLARDADLVRQMLAEAVRVVPAQAAAVLLVDPHGRDLVFSASRRLESGVIDGLRMPADQGIAGWVARHRQALRLDDASQDP